MNEGSYQSGCFVCVCIHGKSFTLVAINHWIKQKSVQKRTRRQVDVSKLTSKEERGECQKEK